MADYAFRGRLISVRVLETPRGPREVVEHPGAVAIVVRDEEGRVLLVRQLREAVGKEVWEIPAGKLEPGEAPEAAAARELHEETGLTAARLRFLGTIYSTPGYSNERLYLYLAEGVTGKPAAASEVSEARFFTREEVAELARAGEGDGKTLAALALVELGDQGEEEPA